MARLASREDGGAVVAICELRRVRIHKNQAAGEWSIGEQGCPIEQVGRDFDEAA